MMMQSEISENKKTLTRLCSDALVMGLRGSSVVDDSTVLDPILAVMVAFDVNS